MTEKYILGQRALSKSKSKIGCLLNTWDYEKYGEPTPETISKLIPMGIKTVKKHIVDFRRHINKIKIAEQERLTCIEEKRQKLIDACLKFRLNKASELEKNNDEGRNENL